MKLLSISAVVLLVASTFAQNSSTTCDPSTCKLPDCLCPSASPPGGLSPNEVPQFVTVTFDDSIQSELLDTAYEIMNVT
jgi:hypothetical protein